MDGLRDGDAEDEGDARPERLEIGSAQLLGDDLRDCEWI